MFKVYLSAKLEAKDKHIQVKACPQLKRTSLNLKVTGSGLSWTPILTAFSVSRLQETAEINFLSLRENDVLASNSNDEKRIRIA